jgi:hypothetical protein
MKADKTLEWMSREVAPDSHGDKVKPSIHPFKQAPSKVLSPSFVVVYDNLKLCCGHDDAI